MSSKGTVGSPKVKGPRAPRNGIPPPPFPVLQKLEAEVTRGVEGWLMLRGTEDERNSPQGGPSLHLAPQSHQLAGQHGYQPSGWGWSCVAATGGQLCLPSCIRVLADAEWDPAQADFQ